MKNRCLCLLGILAAVAPVGQAGPVLRDVAVCTGAAAVTVGSAFFVDGWALLVGAGEFGGAAAYGASTADPPDLINYAIKANNLLIIPSTPVVAGSSAGFANAATSYIGALSVVVKDVKNSEDTVDRLAGAQLVGTPQDIANQTLWLSQFNHQLVTDFRLYQASLGTWTDFFQAEYPSLYNYTPTAADVIAMNNLEAAGTFPSIEQGWMTAYALSAEQIGFCEACFQNALSGSTYGAGVISVGQGLRLLATPTPEPSYSLPLAVMVGFVVILSSKRHGPSRVKEKIAGDVATLNEADGSNSAIA